MSDSTAKVAEIAARRRARQAAPARPVQIDTVDELRSQTNARALIERAVPGHDLRDGSGGRLHGRCPFPAHDDKHPSFALFRDGAYTCSCGTGDIMRLYANLSGQAWSDRDLPRYEREVREHLGLPAAVPPARAVSAQAPPAAAQAPAVQGADPAGATPSSWDDVDLRPILAGGTVDNPPILLERTDGQALLYPGKLHSVHGEPETGKGWIALFACAERLDAGEHVLYLDFEDSAETAVARLLALGVDPDVIAARFHYRRPDDPLNAAAYAKLDSLLTQGIGLAIIDGVTEALALEDIDIVDNTGNARWQNMLPRRITRRGAPVLLIDHVNRDRQARGKNAIGAQHKRAGIDVSYSIDAVTPFGRGVDGESKLTICKDRPGHLRQHGDDHHVVARVQFRSLDDGAVSVTLEPPYALDGESGVRRPTVLMERVSRAVETTPGLTGENIRAAVVGKAKFVDLARQTLITEGYIRVERDGQAHCHHSIKPYHEALDERTRPPVPTPSQPRPGRGQTYPVPPSLPIGDGGRGRLRAVDASGELVPSHSSTPPDLDGAA